MRSDVSDDIEQQEKTVLWGYVLQWSMLLMPLTCVVSLGYVLIMRRKVPNGELRSHLGWQLATLVQVAVLIPVGFGLMWVGASGIGTDAPVSILSVFAAYGITLLFFPWLLYRLIRGSLRFHQQKPMLSMFP